MSGHCGRAKQIPSRRSEQANQSTVASEAWQSVVARSEEDSFALLGTG